MQPTATLALDFQPRLDGNAPGKELRDGLSAVLQVGQTLWVANDESATIERLTLAGGRAGAHVQFELRDYVDLPDRGKSGATPEVDVEGLDWADGYLWVAGSHSLKRCKPDPDDSPRKARKHLARIDCEPNRFLLARIPVAQRDGLPSLLKHDGRKRRAASLPASDKGNALIRALRKDEHLGPFMGLPGKDNGFDIEGLAVAGERLFLGLRGPVLRGWATVLELRPEDDGEGVLALARFGKQPREKVRKHFLQLGGLGVRDLCVQGDDLLLLAGPTMGLDGPVKVVRWPGGAVCEGPSLVPREQLQELLDLPCGTGCDHAEGLTLLRREAGAAPALLVVHDQPARERQPGESTLLADVFELPGQAPEQGHVPARLADKGST
jgi:hypothetical protein